MATRVLSPELEASPGERFLEFSSNQLLIDLCGVCDTHLHGIEDELSVQILRRGNQISIHGDGEAVGLAERAVRDLYARLERGASVDMGVVSAVLRHVQFPGPSGIGSLEGASAGKLSFVTRRKSIEPRTPAQSEYFRALERRTLVFGMGPAGTGKTYIAIAAAVSMFGAGLVERIILSRPAVEAGERLGFLPGDMKEKVDPYMQPMYDALHDFLPARQIEKLIEEKRLQIAPLAFMRGRTLSNSFVILDEAQNATGIQMRMFLTRLGEGSRMVVTGDATQTDLPRGVKSGLREAESLLSGIQDIAFVRFSSRDVVRHPIVAQIVEAYERREPDG